MVPNFFYSSLKPCPCLVILHDDSEPCALTNKMIANVI